MEVDGPTGSIAIPEYLQLKINLKKKSNSSQRGDPLHPMFLKMIEKTNNYLEEALSCETLVMSTILNPFFRLAIFESHFPKEAPAAKKRLVELFEERKAQIEEKIQKKIENGRKKQQDPRTMRRTMMISTPSSVAQVMTQERKN